MPHNQSHHPGVIIVLTRVLLVGILTAGCCAHADNDLVISKISSNGDIVWTHEYYIGHYDTRNVNVVTTADGGCVVNILGNISKLYRFGANGEELWCVPGISSSVIAQNINGDIISIDRWQSVISIVAPNGTLIVNRTDPAVPRFYEYFVKPTVIGTSDGGYVAAGTFGAVKLDSGGNLVWNTSCRNYSAVVELPDGDIAAIEHYPVWIPTPETFNGTWITQVDVVRIHEGTHRETLKPNITGGDFQLYSRPGGFGMLYSALVPNQDRFLNWHDEMVDLVENQTVSRPKIIFDRHVVRDANGGYLEVGYSYDTHRMQAIRYDANGSIAWYKMYVNVTSPSYRKDLFPTSDGGIVYLGKNQHHHTAAG
jgi:hypothetical protein